MNAKAWYLHKRYGRTHYAVQVTKGRRPKIDRLDASSRVIGEGKDKASALASLATQLGVPMDNISIEAL